MDQQDIPGFPKTEYAHRSWSQRIQDFTRNENFVRFFRFGALDQNILLLGLLTGVGIDSIIHKRFGVAGYGPILGAGVSNWLADAIATLPEGIHATAGISVGSFAALFPIFGLMMMKRSFRGTKPPPVLVGVIVGSIVTIFAFEYRYSILSRMGMIKHNPEFGLNNGNTISEELEELKRKEMTKQVNTYQHEKFALHKEAETEEDLF
eukprot:TRINITY_DN3921_c0_g4_i3.p1 TRINITY_DN3921_c0_g4~~TRINITY_DN3921_c0_g4_i3.p1  ORF type:complete len:207 (+),score=24.74 TRINITY_DN3921_c0_g4_i3:146-766(+)